MHCAAKNRCRDLVRQGVLLRCSMIAMFAAMFRTDDQGDTPMGQAPTILEAIVRKRCVTARYNGGDVVIAPHALFQRHDALYVAAATITRDGVRPREEKIGAFKLDGLVGLGSTDQNFFTSTAWDPGDERFAGQVLMAIEA